MTGGSGAPVRPMHRRSLGSSLTPAEDNADPPPPPPRGYWDTKGETRATPPASAGGGRGGNGGGGRSGNGGGGRSGNGGVRSGGVRHRGNSNNGNNNDGGRREDGREALKYHQIDV